MSEQFKRVFVRANEDGTENQVTMAWDPKKPSKTFSMEADGYKGTNCLKELGNIEDIIGVASIEVKPEYHEPDDEQTALIVGMI